MNKLITTITNWGANAYHFIPIQFILSIPQCQVAASNGDFICPGDSNRLIRVYHVSKNASRANL